MTVNISDRLIFLLAGAAAGLLFAPRSGRELRSTIKDKAQHGIDRVSEKVDEGRHYLQESGAKERIREVVERGVEKGRNVATFGRKRLNESIEAGKQKFQESVESEREQEQKDREVSGF